MDRNFMKFTLLFYWKNRMDALNLNHEQAYVLADEIVRRYMRHIIKSRLEQTFETFRSYCSDTDFSDVWEAVKV